VLGAPQILEPTRYSPCSTLWLPFACYSPNCTHVLGVVPCTR
jgi:hypothetical protein